MEFTVEKVLQKGVRLAKLSVDKALLKAKSHTKKGEIDSFRLETSIFNCSLFLADKASICAFKVLGVDGSTILLSCLILYILLYKHFETVSQ